MSCTPTINVIRTDACGGASISTVDYCLPCPSISSFDYSANMGVIRTSVSSGVARQRRLFTNRPTTYDLTWVLTTPQLHTWEAFAQQYGYDWHFLPFVTGQIPIWSPTEHPIRYINNYQVSFVKEDLWQVTVQVEQQHIDTECFAGLFP